MPAIAMETVVLVAGLAALIISAVSLDAINKVKKDVTTLSDADKKKLDTAKNAQIAQIVISVLVVVLSGYLVAGSAAKARGKTLPGADALRRYASQIVA